MVSEETKSHKPKPHNSPCLVVVGHQQGSKMSLVAQEKQLLKGSPDKFN